MSRARFAIATALAGLAVALVAAPALARGLTHTLVPFRSIGGATLRSTPAQIKKRLGKPSAVFHEDGRISGYQYAAGDIQIDFDIQQRQDRSEEVGAVGGSYHTIRGIHTGTSAKTLKRKLRGYDHFSCQGGLGCTISKGPDDAYLTSFGITGGKVTGFSIGYTYGDG